MTFCLLAAVGLAFASQTPAASPWAESQEVSFTLSTEPQSFDPVRAVPIIDAIMQSQVLERLVSYDLSVEPPAIVGQLAASWEQSEDGLEWVFHLRPDSQFYDPFSPPLWPQRRRPVTAQDVLSSWLRQADARGPSGGYWTMDGLFLGIETFRAATAALDPEAAEAAWQAALQDGIPGLQVRDATTLVIRLQRPDPHLLDRLAMPFYGVYPLEAVSRADRRLDDQPVGSSPFYLAGWLPGQQVTLRRDPSWPPRAALAHGGVPYLDQVQFQVVREASTREEMFRRGSTARLSLSTFNAETYLEADGSLKKEWAEQGIRLHAFDNHDLTMLCFGMEDPVVGLIPGDEEGNRRRALLRRAIALAFPRAGWAELVRGRTPAIPAQNFLAPGIPGAETLPPLSWAHRDLEEARRLLAEAGYPQGQGLEPLELLLTGTDPFSRAIGQRIAAGLAEADIPVKVVPLSFREQQERARRGEAQLFLRAWVPDWPDGALILQNFHGELVGTDINLGHVQDAAFDRLFTRYRALPEGPARTELGRQLCARLEALVPAVPIDHRQSRILIQPWLDGVHIAVQQLFDLRSYRVRAH